MSAVTDHNAPAALALREGTLLHLAPSGDWSIGEVRQRKAEMARLDLDGVSRIDIDLTQVTRLDTAGAWILIRAIERWRAAGIAARFARITPAQRIILQEIAARAPAAEATHAPPRPSLADSLAATGETVAEVATDVVEVTGFLGSVVARLGALALRPWRLRGISIVHHLDITGLRAVPIIALMSFLIGGIVAQQGAFQLQRFGASLFVVDLVGILVLREIGLLLTAVMVAGRSGSAFTAEIGSMKMREEIDALRVFGLDPLEVLVVPRLIALVIALPLLTIIADMAALAGAGLLAWAYVGVPPDAFLARLRNAVGDAAFFVGLVKAPFMALIIGLIACVEGLRVQGSAESLGRQTTAAVVKAIFMVIVVDGLFAIFFAAIRY